MVEALPNPEKEVVKIILLALAILIFMGVAIVLFFYFSRKKIIKTQLEKAHLEIAYQKELLQATILTQEEERKRIAQDLHDAISSKLNVVSLNANFLIEKDITQEDTHRIGEGIQKVTKSVLESSRRIAHDLLPPTLEKFGLKAALEELCEEVDAAQRFQIQYNISYPEGVLSSTNELHFFRIVQELFNNTIKHSGAKAIVLSLRCSENLLSLQYTDDGKGFEVVKAKTAKGLGMSGIENRALLMNAEFMLESAPEAGMRVEIKYQRNNEH